MSKIYVDEIAGIASADTVAIPGHVIQVVNNTATTSFNTTSTSFVAYSPITSSITPSSTSNKILIIANIPAYSIASTQCFATVYRGTISGTNLGASLSGFGGSYNNSNNNIVVNYLDSPSTTSSQTYTVAVRSNNGNTVYMPDNNATVTLTLMEIAG